MAELLQEFRGMARERPATDEELAAAQDRLTLTLGGRYETSQAGANVIADLVRFSFPDDYYDTYAAKIRNVSVADVNDTAKSVLKPEALVWVVIGDRSRIERGIRELGLGEVRLIDVE